jgi:RHS repeat-associated protein
LHDEGRALPIDATNWEYQYILRDHLGSARIMLSATPRYKEYKATLETENATAEEANFINLPGTRFTYSLANSTSGGDEVAKINNTNIVGPSISLQVMPGDAIVASAYAYHEGTGFGTGVIAESSIISAIAGAFGGVSSGAGEAGQIFNGVQSAIGTFGPGASPADNHPAAYLNYLVFDINMIPVTGGYVRVGTSPGSVSMSPILIDKPGYIFFFLTNETNSTTPVYFDDFTVQHQESKLAGVYLNYPFGAEIDSQTFERHRMPDNLYRYQSKELQNELGISLYDFHARLYDPYLGRWFAVDPKGQFASPFLAMGNNPMIGVDPNGEWLHLLFGALIGGTINVLTHLNKIDNFGEGLKYFGVGALAGALAAGVGAGVNVALANGSFGAGFLGTAAGVSSTGFIAGAATGASAGVFNGLISGTGNGLLENKNFKESINKGLNDGWKQGLAGGVTGGIFGGIDALRKDVNFFTGKAEMNLSDGFGAHGLSLPKNDQTITGKFVGKYEGVNVYESSKLGYGDLSGGITLPGRGIIVGDAAFSKGLAPTLMQHEFGHILQANEVGIRAFYSVIGSESLTSASMNGVLGHSHSAFWTETWANYLSKDYFGAKYISSSSFPVRNISWLNYLKLQLFTDHPLF